MNSSIAHIVYASDDRFAEILGVSLVSLYENSKDMDDLIIYVLDSGIAKVNKEKIERIAEKYKRSHIIWLPAQDISRVLSMKVKTDRGSISQYARLFVSSSLPKEVDRVLYLDCDTLVVKSIKELWNLDLQNKTIGALLDAFSELYRRNIELQPNDIMFNSGVMLIDMKRWKKQNVEDRLLEFIESHNGVIQQGDQGALNAVLSYDTFCFEPRFNSVTIYYDFDYDEMMLYRKPANGFYKQEEIREATENPSIIHFTTSFLSKRPWVVGCQHRYVELWLQYKKLSPWADVPLMGEQKDEIKSIVIKILNLMPRRWMLRVAGLAQAYGRPLKNRLLGRTQK